MALQLAFVDTRLADWQVLVSGLNPSVELVLLDAETNGLVNVTAADLRWRMRERLKTHLKAQSKRTPHGTNWRTRVWRHVGQSAHVTISNAHACRRCSNFFLPRGYANGFAAKPSPADA